MPSAKAIIAGDEVIRSSLFFVDKGQDTGPVLAQSRPVDILQTIDKLASAGREDLSEGLHKITSYVTVRGIRNYEDFEAKAGQELLDMMELVCKSLQEALKVAGDWKIYPFAVHDLIARGRVQIDGNTVYVDDKEMPEYGYRIDEYE